MAGLKFYLPLFPEVNYGDIIVVEGRVEGDRLKEVELIKVEEARGALFRLRRRFVESYQAFLPEPHAGLLAGVTLGSKANLAANFWNSLKSTGTAHVVVASGMNVTLVAGFLINLLILFMPRKRAILVALFWGLALFLVLRL